MKRKNVNTHNLANNVNKRKQLIHYTKQLKSGKTAHMWFNRYSRRTLIAGNLNFKETYWWDVGLYVGNSNKDARLWYNGKRHGNGNPITGDGTLEALAWALRTIEEFADNLPPENIVTVGWADSRRHGAYSYLVRRKGWHHDAWEKCYWRCGGKQCTT